MRFEGFIDYWAHRIARHAANSADAAATSVRCSEALDAEIGYRDTPERTEIIERLRAETARIRSAEKTERLARGYGAGVSRFMDGYDDPRGPTGRYGRNLPKYGGRLTEETAQRAVGKVPELAMGYWGDTVQYGRSPAMSAMPDIDMVRSLHRTLFNTEGEKRMEKIDWHKPLRAVYRIGDGPKVYTYKSGKQRVTWHDDRVYPVDDFGRVMADVWYPGRGAFTIGEKIVENVPEEEEEKFFLGLGRNPDGTYWLTDGGAVSDMGTMNYWKKVMGDQPHWIVDTRKSAEPPKAIEHDPKDYVTIWEGRNGSTQVSDEVMTKAKAEAYVSEPGERVVRVRTTPPPADTARYIVLWREGSNLPWRVNKFGDGRQEFTWAEVGFRAGRPDYCIVKVRD